MDKNTQEISFSVAKAKRPLIANISALKEEIAGLNMYRKKKDNEISTLKAELTRKNEALEDCMTIALNISSGDIQTGLAVKAILAVVSDALEEVE